MTALEAMKAMAQAENARCRPTWSNRSAIDDNADSKAVRQHLAAIPRGREFTTGDLAACAGIPEWKAADTISSAKKAGLIYTVANQPRRPGLPRIYGLVADVPFKSRRQA